MPFSSLRYDEAGNVVKSQASNGGETEMQYTIFGETAMIEDPDDNVTHYVYNGMGQRIAEEIDLNKNGTFGESGEKRTITYDAWGNIDTTTDRNDRTVDYTYDKYGRKIAETYDTYSASWDYTALGELESAEDNVSDYFYTYDAFRRLDTVRQDYTIASSRVPSHLTTQTFAFDYNYYADGRVQTVDVYEQSANDGTPDWSMNYAWTNEGRIETIVQSGSVVNDKSVAYEYDNSGTYGENGPRISQTSMRRYVSDITASAADPAISTRRYNYGDGQFAMLHHYQGNIPENSGADATSEDTYLYLRNAYNARGLNTYSKKETWDDGEKTTRIDKYEYDKSGQMTSFLDEDGQKQFINYTPNGNQQGTGIGAYNRLLNDGKHAYAYDAEGNLTERWTFVEDSSTEVETLEIFAWDHHNRLTGHWMYETVAEGTPDSVERACSSDSAVSAYFETTADGSEYLAKTRTYYAYDVHNQLIGNWTYEGNTGDPVETYFTVPHQGHRSIEYAEFEASETDMKEDFDGSGEKSEEKTNVQSTVRRMYGTQVDQLLAADWNFTVAGAKADGTDYTAHRNIWTLNDHQGSLHRIVEMTSGGSVKYNKLFKMNRFGEPETEIRYASPIVSFYAGRDYDYQTEMYQNRARWYDPVAKRFISEDPIGFAAGDTNLYRYAANSPANATDPTGNFLITGTILGIATVLTLTGTGTLLYAAHRYDEAGKILEKPAAEMTQADVDRFNETINSARFYHATGEILGYTGIAMAAAPLAGAGVSFVGGALPAMFGTTGMVMNSVLGVGLLGMGGAMIGSEGYSIAQDWNKMDGIERYHRVGMLVGPTLAGFSSGIATAGWSSWPAPQKLIHVL